MLFLLRVFAAHSNQPIQVRIPRQRHEYRFEQPRCGGDRSNGRAGAYACTGASPSTFAICGLPPESRTTFSPFRASIGLAFAPAFGGDLDLAFGELSRAVADLRGLLARVVPTTEAYAVA